MNTIYITLEDDLIIEVTYYWQPEEPAEIGPEAQYPGCPAEVKDVYIEEIKKGSIDDLIYYVENTPNFSRKLEELVYETKCEEDNNNY